MKFWEWVTNLTFHQLASLLLQGSGLYYVVRNFIRANEIREETLDWNKKMATEKELTNKPKSDVSHVLNEILDLRKREDVISLKEIEEKDREYKDKSLDGKINHLLNRYERLARGILTEIYDEPMAKNAIRTIYVKNYINFAAYIQSKREKDQGTGEHDVQHKKAFADFETVAYRWDDDNRIKKELDKANSSHI